MEVLINFGADSVAFTINEDYRLRELISNCSVAESLGPDGESQPDPNFLPFKALWDTGATNSVITERVVRDCNLVPTGKTIVRGVSGEHLADTYVASILLSDVVCFTAVTVTKGDFSGADVLIGMDIIGLGDFAVTNKDGRTSFMFRYPSVGGLDFVGLSEDDNEDA